jgi:hypothetical protein
VVNIHRFRGSAMTETVLVLPLVFFILALLFFFGQAMTRWQRSSVTDRYEAWRQTQYGVGPGVEFAKRGFDFGPGEQLNQAFFGDNADRLDVADRSGRINVQEPVDIIAEDARQTAAPSDMPDYDPASAEELVRELHDRAPAWWRIDLSTEHATDVPLYERFTGPVRHQSTRIDGDWSFATWLEQEAFRDRAGRTESSERYIDRVLHDDVLYSGDENDSDGLRDLHELRPQALFGIYYTYYEDADQPLETLADQGNPLAQGIRGIYLNLPAYVGPVILPEVPYYVLRMHTSSSPDPGQDP